MELTRVTRSRRLILIVAGLAVVGGLSACGTRRADPYAIQGQVPDDFRVVARAPLVIPPEYALRPPSPGEPRPQELNPESAARAALVGNRVIGPVSDGERLLIARAGGTNADPMIRQIVDDETSDISHKPASFANLVMFWQPGRPVTPTSTPGANEPAPIDPAEEAARIQALTGNYGVIIQRTPAAPERNRRFKLPGL